MNTLRRAICTYAANIRDALEGSIGVLNSVGAPLSRSLYQEAKLHVFKQSDMREWSAPGDRPRSFGSDFAPDHLARGLPPPLPEDRVLDEWRKEGFDRNLLIIAPVGAGKSCLLESFALRLAKDLLENCKWPPSRPLPPAVPVLVSLAEWAQLRKDQAGREGSLEAYITREEWEIPKSKPLGRATIERLRANRKLILLADGFDEVSHLRHELAAQINKLGMPFALTSRPGHGEQLVVTDAARHRTLAELSSDAARRFVGAYFTGTDLDEFGPEAALRLFRDAQSGSAAALLARPLYVKAWCQYVYDLVYAGHIPQNAPASLCELAEQLYRDFIRQRPLFEKLREADSHEHGVYRQACDKFATWLGRLGAFFAENNFEPLRLASDNTGVELQAINRDSTFSVTHKNQSQSFNFKDIAIDAGLLVKSALDNYHLLTLPVVEYLVGRSAAQDACEDPHAPRILVKTFRRWIWQPRLHDILDYTFDTLWHGTKAQRGWATALLGWAVEAGRHDLKRAPTLSESTQDDLIRPFALTSLRWHCLDPNADNSLQAQQAARAAAVALAAAQHAGIPKSRGVDGPPIPSNVLRCFLSDLIRHQVRGIEEHNCELVDTIEVAASRISERQAAQFVEWLMQQAKSAAEDEKGEWHKTAVAAAEHVSEDQVVETVQRWLHQLLSADNNVAAVWRDVLQAVATRIPEDQAVRIVEQLIRRSAVMHQGMRLWTFRPLVATAARSVAERDAANTIKRWIGELLTADSVATRLWWQAIRGATDCVAGDVAAQVVEWLIPLCAATSLGCDQTPRFAMRAALERVPEDWIAGLVEHWIMYCAAAEGNEKREWRSAVVCVIERLPEDLVAAGLLERWIGYYVAAKDDVKREWPSAVKSAIYRMPEEQATQILDQCIHQYNATQGETRNEWASAITAATRRVPHDQVLGVVDRLVRLHGTAAGAARVSLRLAIRGAACHVSADHVEQLVKILVKEYVQAANKEKSDWELSIGGAALQVSEPAAKNVIGKWTQEWKKAELVAKPAWHCAIQSLTVHFARNHVGSDQETQDERLGPTYLSDDRVPVDEAARLIGKWTRLYSKASDAQKDTWRIAIESVVDHVSGEFSLPVVQQLAGVGLLDLAMELAASANEIAVLSKEVDDGRSIEYSFVLRTDPSLILDKDGVAAPEFIRRVIGPWVTAEELYERLRNLISDDVRKNQLKGKTGSRYGHLPPWAEAPQQIRRAALAIWEGAARQACVPWGSDENAGPLAIDVEAICKDVSRLLQIAQDRIPNAAEELAHYLYYRFLGTSKKLNQAEIAKAFKCREPGALCAALGLDLRSGDHEGFLYIRYQKDVSLAIRKVNAWANAGCFDLRPERLDKCRTPEEWLAAGGVYIHPKPQSLNAMATGKRLAFFDPAFVAEADAEDRRIRRRGRGKRRE